MVPGLIPHLTCWKPFIPGGVKHSYFPKRLLLNGVIDIKGITPVTRNANIRCTITIHIGNDGTFRVGM
jgi:hypothetical protein